MVNEAEGTLRIDKWLWQARFFKSRTLAAKYVGEGRLRLNGVRVAKSHASVKAGDVLTFPVRSHVRVIEIKALGTRRGPAAEAQKLYDDLSPPDAPAKKAASDNPAPVAPREPGAGRPTKRERRDLDRLRDV